LEVDHVLRLQRLNVGFSREGANPLLHIEKDGFISKKTANFLKHANHDPNGVLAAPTGPACPVSAGG
jgi:hypothetical protein